MEMVSCTTLGASSSISVTVASCSMRRVYPERSEGSFITPAAQVVMSAAGVMKDPSSLRSSGLTAWQLPHARFEQLLNLLEQTLLLESAQPVDEQSAIEVIGLVAQR